VSDWFQHSREPRPCERCGHVRTVKVTRTPRDPDGYWSRLCTACDADSSTFKHEQAAVKFRALAAKIRAGHKRNRQT